jgi:hypothetical protein
MALSSATAAPPPVERMILTSQGLPAWLAAQDVSLALTTYQAGRLFFIGRKPDGGLRAHERLIEHCQGLWTDGTELWTSGNDALALSQRSAGRRANRTRRRPALRSPGKPGHRRNRAEAVGFIGSAIEQAVTPEPGPRS